MVSVDETSAGGTDLDEITQDAEDRIEATEAAITRANELGVEVTEAPAESASEAPACFGDFDPTMYPCSPCKVRPDCQLVHLGLA